MTLGKIRRSQIISTYGPGAIVDFRTASGAPVSTISGGLELWKKAIDHRQDIHEVRLEKKLGVSCFCQPPVGQRDTGKRDAKGNPIYEDRSLPALRFPEWCFCPVCDALKKAGDWAADLATGDLFCLCQGDRGPRRRHYVVPVRFVTACENGHLDEFPWNKWVDHLDSCTRPSLRLSARGAGISGLYVVCDTCKSEKSLARAYGEHAMERIGHKCTGRRPWLPGSHAQACNHPAVVIQRGSSNGYFPMIESAIDIPPFSDDFTTFVRGIDYWDSLTALVDLNQIAGAIDDLGIRDDWTGPPMPRAEMVRQIRLLLERHKAEIDPDLREEEYASFLADPEEAGHGRNFRVIHESLPPELAGIAGRLVRVERLREVRVLTGFTRVTPTGQEKNERAPAALSRSPMGWLPATEVYGEGIFVTLDIDRLRVWENRPAVQARAAVVNANLARLARDRGNEEETAETITARHILLHTLAHALIERLSLDCGYSSSSIRERLYVGPEGSDMAGFLLYTSAPGADGTLGGLSREGRPDRFGPTMLRAIADTRWCSGDPLCADGLASMFEMGNGAACHCCSYLPETSCEHFNRFLDRAFVTGGLGNPELAFVDTVDRE